MIIQIRDDLFYKLVELMKHRNLSIYNELKEILSKDKRFDNATIKIKFKDKIKSKN